MKSLNPKKSIQKQTDVGKILLLEVAMCNNRSYKIKIAVLIGFWVTLSACWSLHSEKDTIISPSSGSILTSTTNNTKIKIILNPQVTPTGGKTPMDISSSVYGNAEKKPTIVLTRLPTVTSTLKELISTVKVTSQTPTQPPLITASSTQASHVEPGWITFAGYGEYPYGIDIIHTSGKGLRRIVQVKYPESPSWSPDGQWIAFIGSPENGNAGSEIYMSRPDGSKVHRLTYTLGYKGGFSWSPDGKKIVYSQTTEYAGSFHVELYVIDVNSRLINQLTDTPEISEGVPAWSPQGDKIAFISAGVNDHPLYYYLMVMDADGKNAQRVSDINMDVNSLAWAPDNNQIVFSAGDKCKDLYLIYVDGSDLRRLTNDPDQDDTPSWSPDGKWIAYTNSPCHNGVSGVLGTRIYLIQADGSGMKKLAGFGSEDTLSPDWSPLPGLKVGGRFTITELGDNINLRSSPSLSGTILTKLEEGITIQVVDGPIETDMYLWWKVYILNGDREGWIAENPGWFFPVP